MLTTELVKELDWVDAQGGACPEAYSGWLWSGEYFYYRLRHGVVNLRTWNDGLNPETILAPDGRAIEYYGDPLCGSFDSDDDTNAVFVRLHARIFGA